MAQRESIEGLSLWLSAGRLKLLLDFRPNFVKPRLASFDAVAIGSKVALQLRDTIASGLKLLCQPLRGFQGLPGILIGGICRLVQEIQDRPPSPIDGFKVIIAGVHTAV
jgi:hypothetical protein